MTAIASLEQRVHDALNSNPNAMMLQLARDLGMPEADVVRALPRGRAVELDLGRWDDLMAQLATLGKVHVIVTNAAVTLEANGEFGNFSKWGEFFNVQTKTLDMHIRPNNLGAAFAVEKPSHMTGVGTLSVQFFDVLGSSAFKVFLSFGQKPPTPKQVEWFQQLKSGFGVRGAGSGN